ncbi:hypothetical protein F0562_016809 [Nyssa sinensis]|uniref:Growth-regulating factor n=1 Tax=Nyssa sinensis TaxID=561372 RepID=A0A5J4ZDF3_9ASTE|nr:hypothetical protein F0562_016809 [Nyssa sinensis]
MDFHLKQWRNQEHESDHPSAKLPRLLLDSHQEQQQQQPSGSPALPLFVPELTSKLSNLSAFPADSTTTATGFSRMGGHFSLAQCQELELQALIFRHILAGVAVPPELLHLVKKSLLNSPPYYLHHPLQHYSHYQPALLQSGYWGRAAMDPEPGRCRRTDGKKWRCSRDVVAGQKYCERHMHRGRNRSRKPVEIPTPSTASAGGGGEVQTNTPIVAQPLTAMAGGTHFTLSGPSPSIDLLNLHQRPSEQKIENKCLYEPKNESLQEPDNTATNAIPVTSATSLSISIQGNNLSDFSLKLSTGNGDESGPPEENVERERPHLNWASATAAAGGWGTNQVAPMGGPLAEALRSSTSNSSPTSVLHQLPPRGSTSETSYVST